MAIVVFCRWGRACLTVLGLGLMVTLVTPQELQAQNQIQHVVRTGDTLMSIAARYGTTVDAIVTLNGMTTKDHVHAGRILRVPGASDRPAAAGPGCIATHVIHVGENLLAVALRYEVSMDAIALANSIANIDRISVGQRLCIPSGTSVVVQAPVPAPLPLVSLSQAPLHTVAAGDNLYRISLRYGVPTALLMAVNRISDPTTLGVGQVLVIPGPGVRPSRGTLAAVSAISAGDEHTCGVRADSTLACWGNDGYGQATPPGGIFATVSAGAYHACGVRADSTLACWGNDAFGQAAPPDGRAMSVSAGEAHTCRVGEDGSLACWGNDAFGQAVPPDGTFAAVSAGRWHTCGVREDGSLACWGRNDHGQTMPPDGTFAGVSVGDLHTCGVREGGGLVCWGHDAFGQAVPPDGAFAAVSAGSEHNCATRTDGSLVCWGRNDHGQAAPPDGAFTLVSAGRRHTCGVNTDGTLICWGLNDHGQAVPPVGTVAGAGY